MCRLGLNAMGYIIEHSIDQYLLYFFTLGIVYYGISGAGGMDERTDGWMDEWVQANGTVPS